MNEIQDNQLIVKYNDEIIKTFDIVSISSEKYNLNNEYLLVGKDTVEQSDITVTNGEVSIEDDEVLIKRDDDVLQTFYKSAFKDQNFYNCIIDRYNESSTLEDISYSKHLSDEKLAKFTFIQCNGMNADDDKKITNTDGIEKLTNLETLYIINHALVSIDTNQNSALETLHLYNNKLTNIHSEKNSKLVELDINNNELTNIDVTMYPGLTKLNISHNNLNFIDVSQNQKLTYLDVSFNQLSSLELKNLPLLKTLYTSNNQLSTLDLKTNTKLQLLDITKNQIAHLDLKNNLDISVFSAKDNLFNANIALYKNEYKNISKDLGFVEWPSEKTIIFRGIHDKDSEIGWDYDNNSITSSTVGMYHIGASYGLASSSYSNEYRGIYNVYVIEATSSKYTIGDDYIYVGAETNNDTILNNIELNYGTKEIQDNQLVIKYNDEIIKTFDIVSISSDDYDLKKDYIYTVNEDFDLNKVDVINGSKEQVEDELQIKRDTTILDRFELLSIKFGELKVGNKRIVIKDETTYEDFTGNITINGVTYKIYNDQEEVDNGTISKGMTLKVYKDDEEIDSFEITNEYLDWGNLVRDEEHKVIKKVKAGTTVEDIVNEISTSGTIIKKDKNGSPLQDEDVIKTGDVIRVELSSENYEYKISVVGDVTGDGQVNIADVGKLYKHVRGTGLMEEWCEKIAGDVVEDNNIIISDVGKLYKYVRNTIEEL